MEIIKIAKIFKATAIRKRKGGNMFDDIEVFTEGDDTNFAKINIWFDKDELGDFFTVSIADKYVLNQDGKKLTYVEEDNKATKFRASEKKPHLTIRATDCIGYTLMGKFPIEKTMKDGETEG